MAINFWRQQWQEVTNTNSVLTIPQTTYNFKQVKVSDYDYYALEKNYRKEGQEILQEEESLKYLRNTKPLTNTCAIKLSWTLNKSGYYIPKARETPSNVRIQNNHKKVNQNYILDAESMVNYLKLIEKPLYSFSDLNTKEKVENAISEIHKSDDMLGIVGLVAGDKQAYGATGHVDLLYEDFMWDLSLYSYGGDDLYPYLLKRLNINFDLYVWVLQED